MNDTTDTTLSDDVTSTITVDAAKIRAAVTREFRDHGGEGNGEWTSRELSDLVFANKPDTDARVLRALAVRTAGPGRNEDPGTTLIDITAALKAMAVTVAALGSQEMYDDDPERFDTYAATVEHLRSAADGVAEMAAWF